MSYRTAATTAIAVTVLLAAGVVSSCSREPTVSPVDFVTAHASQAQSVVMAVQKVQAGATIITDDSVRAQSFDGVLSDAQSTFENVNRALLHAPKPRAVESSATEMWSATDELSSAMKAARAYLADRKPSELTDYKTHWNRGRAWWNQAVAPIWQAARQVAPIIDNAPPAPPVSK